MAKRKYANITDVVNVEIEEPSLFDQATAMLRNPGAMGWPGRDGWVVGADPAFKKALRERNLRQEAQVRAQLLNWVAR